jgi:undecaprenyl-diphosphatase
MIMSLSATIALHGRILATLSASGPAGMMTAAAQNGLPAADPSSGPTLLIAIILGLLQGLTEFLPISSSGHLVLAQAWLAAPQQGIVLEVVLHAGTLLAVLCSFRRDLLTILTDTRDALFNGRWAPRRWPAGFRTFVWIGLATIPVVIVGLLWKESIVALFESPRLATVALMGTGVLLLLTRWIPRGVRPIGWRAALMMGFMQVLSLMPGISRSGATIFGGLLTRAEPERVARFSFMMSIPAIVGSLVLEFPAMAAIVSQGNLLPYALGFVAAFLSGLAAIEILLRVVAKGRFFLFGIYCLVVGIVGFLLI